MKEKNSAISRVLQIVEVVSKAERPMSPADLACVLDIPKPSVHRLLAQMEAEGYLQVNMRGLLMPGERMQEIALGVLYNSKYKAPRQAILKRLALETGETCGIAIPNGTEMIYYDRVQTERPLQVHLPIGTRTPVWCTSSGKLYLSSLPRERRQRIIRNLPLRQFARNTIIDPDALEESILKIKMSDVGTDEEEFVDGLVACSVPISGQDGRLFACLFLHAPLFRKNLAQLLTYTQSLRKAASDIGQLIRSPEGRED